MFQVLYHSPARDKVSAAPDGDGALGFALAVAAGFAAAGLDAPGFATAAFLAGGLPSLSDPSESVSFMPARLGLQCVTVVLAAVAGASTWAGEANSTVTRRACQHPLGKLLGPVTLELSVKQDEAKRGEHFLRGALPVFDTCRRARGVSSSDDESSTCAADCSDGCSAGATSRHIKNSSCASDVCVPAVQTPWVGSTPSARHSWCPSCPQIPARTGLARQTQMCEYAHRLAGCRWPRWHSCSSLGRLAGRLAQSSQGGC